jgi:hypothetical protein
MTNNLKQNDVGDENTITETKNESMTNVCENIMRRKLLWIKKSSILHNNKYDYSHVDYVNNHTKVKIGCLKNPFHGFFYQRPNNHLNGDGCPICSRNDKCTKEKFIEKSIFKHGNKYDYSKFNYINYTTKGEIVCFKHGSFFQRPSSHISGKGCLECGKETSSLLQRSNKNEFIEKAKKKHKFKNYNYSNINYINNSTKISILCPIHGIFFQTPQIHLRGGGCPKCTNRISKPEIEFLGYLKIPDTKENRQVYILKKKIDGYDDKTNTIYEFLGDYYHGNPKKYDSKKYNQICHKTFGELYKDTFKKFETLKSLGYNVKYIWESDWKMFKKQKIKNLNIKEY